MSVVLAGFVLNASLIVAIGPQNLMIINYGIRRQAVTAVVLTCFLSDIALFVGGMLGVNLVVTHLPWALEVLRWVGVAFLLVLAVQSAREAARPRAASLRAAEDTVAITRRNWIGPVRTMLAVTWLNPGSFLDTLVIGGSIANQYGDPGRWWFVCGALIASALWFPLLGYGAAALAGPLSRPMVWRVLKGIIAVLLVAIALRLALA